jgi:hypothetical protein
MPKNQPFKFTHEWNNAFEKKCEYKKLLLALLSDRITNNYAKPYI